MENIENLWKRFIQNIQNDKTDSDLISGFNSPAHPNEIRQIEALLKISLPNNLKQLYYCCNGFSKDIFIGDGFRLLPVQEMAEKTIAFYNTLFVTDELAGEFFYWNNKKVTRLFFADYKKQHEDIYFEGLLIRKKGNAIKEETFIYYKADGIHDYEEVVDTGETLAEWLEGKIDIYGQ